MAVRDRIQRGKHTGGQSLTFSDTRQTVQETSQNEAPQPVLVQADRARAADHTGTNVLSQCSILPPGAPLTPPNQTHVRVQPTMPRFDVTLSIPLQREPDLGTRIAAQLGRGVPLPIQAREHIEKGLGADLSGVRVHTDSAADRLTTSVQAVAFTTGSDIFFKSGAYNPHSHRGMHLLAHEATHAIQQSRGPVDGTPHPEGVSVSDPNDRFERIADAAAAGVTSGEPAVQPVCEAQSPTSLQRAVAPGQRITIQRKVGFEFEGGYWHPFIRDNDAWRLAARKETLHQGTGFELQADDSMVATNPLKPSIEFVTDPFDLTKQGLKDLKTSLKEIKAIMKRISKHAHWNYLDQLFGEDARSVDGPITGVGLVRHNKHQLSNHNVGLAGGNSNLPDSETFKMQVTQGTSLEDLPRLMRLMGTNVPNMPVSPNQTKMRKLMYGKDPANYASDALGEAPNLAAQALAYLGNNRNNWGFSGPDATWFGLTEERLLGFLSRAIVYVVMFRFPGSELMKYSIPLLGRIEFSTLFRELNARHRALLAKNNAQPLIDAVVHGAQQKAAVGNVTFAGITANTPLMPYARRKMDVQGMKQYVTFMQSLTIGEWLKGIVNGDDYLTPTKMDTWLQNNEPNLDALGRTAATEMLESFNTLDPLPGMGDPDRLTTSKLDILENRLIAPNNTRPGDESGKFTVDKMSDAAVAYFSLLLKTIRLGKE